MTGWRVWTVSLPPRSRCHRLPRPPAEFLATLEKLEERKRELEERLAEGDLSAEAALERVDKAIRARTLEVQYARKRHAAVKDAVKAGVPLDEARKRRSQAELKRLAKTKRPLNRF